MVLDQVAGKRDEYILRYSGAAPLGGVKVIRSGK